MKNEKFKAKSNSEKGTNVEKSKSKSVSISRFSVKQTTIRKNLFHFQRVSLDLTIIFTTNRETSADDVAVSEVIKNLLTNQRKYVRNHIRR